MYNLNNQEHKILMDVYTLLQQLEVKGGNNINIMFNCLTGLGSVLQSIDKKLQEELEEKNKSEKEVNSQ